MKKFLLLFLFIATSYVAINAQKGRQGLGIEGTWIGMFSEPSSIGASLKYQYGLTNTFRLEPYFSYFFTEMKYGSVYYDDSPKYYPRMVIGMNLHTLFYKGNRLWSYLITGASYSNMRYQPYISGYIDPSTRALIKPDNYELSDNKFGGNFGLGLEYRANYSLNIVLELGYNTASKEFAGIGIVYNFKN